MSTNLTNIALMKRRLNKRQTDDKPDQQKMNENNSTPQSPSTSTPETSIRPTPMKRFVRPRPPTPRSLSDEKNTSETTQLHELITSAVNSTVTLKPDPSILSAIQTQTVLPNLVVTPAVQLRIKDENKWFGMVLCHPSSPQANVSGVLYTGNKLFIVYERENILNENDDLKKLIDSKVITSLTTTDFKPKNKEFKIGLYNATSNVIVIDSKLDFDEMSNLKICFKSDELASLTSLHKKMIKFSLWPNNILFPELTEVSRYFDLFKQNFLRDIELETTDNSSSLFIVSNDKYQNQSENVLEFVEAQPNSQLIISKINDMSERFGTNGQSKQFMIGVIPATANSVDDKLKNHFSANHVILMLNPVNVIFDNHQLLTLIFTYLNKFIMEGVVVQVYTTDLINVEDMFKYSFSTIECFYQSIGCTLINHVHDSKEVNTTTVPISVADVEDAFENVDVEDNSLSTQRSDDDKNVEGELTVDLKKSVIDNDVMRTEIQKLDEPPKQWVDEIDDDEKNSAKMTVDEKQDILTYLTYEEFLMNPKMIDYACRYANDVFNIKALESEKCDLVEQAENLLLRCQSIQQTNEVLEERLENETKRQEQLSIEVSELNAECEALTKSLNDIKLDCERLNKDNLELKQVMVERTAKLEMLENARNVSDNEEVSEDEHNEQSEGYALFSQCIEAIRTLREKYPHLYSGTDANFGNVHSLLKMLKVKIASINSICDAGISVSENQWSAYGLCCPRTRSADSVEERMLTVNDVALMNVSVSDFSNMCYDMFVHNVFIKFFWSLSLE
ncbi:hypothetical protein MRCV_sS6gp1 [Mal de Rio Cuarto virus]|uniref:Uncharacterized protein n=1 Tax=Mal de Rio Cuarto virus TaxID=185954 RepID=Q809E9_9REOV|nr:hypothetical protein MRCV_sS6gp1 [Mal de Rio Cuarto virus]AAO73184.1 unknown [Mal de Rio Cuarto virus]